MNATARYNFATAMKRVLVQATMAQEDAANDPAAAIAHADIALDILRRAIERAKAMSLNYVEG